MKLTTRALYFGKTSNAKTLITFYYLTQKTQTKKTVLFAGSRFPKGEKEVFVVCRTNETVDLYCVLHPVWGLTKYKLYVKEMH